MAIERVTKTDTEVTVVNEQGDTFVWKPIGNKLTLRHEEWIGNQAPIDAVKYVVEAASAAAATL